MAEPRPSANDCERWSASSRVPLDKRDPEAPCDGIAATVERVLVKEVATGLRIHSLGSREHAARVSWRVVKEWLEANLALIAAGMASPDETMLPYLHVAPERTLYQAYREREAALELTAGVGA